MNFSRCDRVVSGDRKITLSLPSYGSSFVPGCLPLARLHAESARCSAVAKSSEWIFQRVRPMLSVMENPSGYLGVTVTDGLCSLMLRLHLSAMRQAVWSFGAWKIKDFSSPWRWYDFPSVSYVRMLSLRMSFEARRTRFPTSCP